MYRFSFCFYHLEERESLAVHTLCVVLRWVVSVSITWRSANRLPYEHFVWLCDVALLIQVQITAELVASRFVSRTALTCLSSR